MVEPDTIPLLGSDFPPPRHHERRNLFLAQTLRSAFHSAQRIFTKSTIKATVTYMVAILGSFSQFSNDRLQGSVYLLATAVLYFHPARTVGAMVEALICCIVGLSAGFLVATACLHLALHYEREEKNMIEAHLLALTTLFLVTFVLAFVRAKFGTKRPAIATGCTLTHILTFVTITQIASEKSLHQLSDKILRISLGLLSGTMISACGCWVLWPKTAASALRQDISKSLANLRGFFDALSSTFSLAAEPKLLTPILPRHENGTAFRSSTSDAGSETVVDVQHERLEELVEAHQKTLLRIEISRYEITFEPTTSMFLHRRQYRAIFGSAERLAQHVGGLQSSIVEIDNIVTHDADNQALVEFMDHMDEPLRRLIITCKQTMALLETVFGTPVQNGEDADTILPALENLAERLVVALDEFDACQRHVLVDIYKHVHEDVFLVFFFTFELLETGKELIRLVNAVHSLKLEVLERARVGKIRWLWRTRGEDMSSSRAVWQQGRTHLDRPNMRVAAQAPHFPRTLSFPAPGTQEDVSQTKPWALRVWTIFSSLKKFEVRFALKTAITVALLALPAYLEPTQDFFYEYRMHWALSTFVVIMTPSVGGTNSAGLWRILGTMGGALTAVVVGILFADNEIRIFMACAVVCLPCMFGLLHSRYPKIGQIFLLTYSICILNDYAGKVDPVTGKEYTIVEIAVRRGFAVCFGVVAGLFVSWYVWPVTARKALRVGLSNTLYDMGLLYSRLVGLFDSSTEPTREDLSEFLEDELSLRLSLAELRQLLAQTKHEPRLKGAFPRNTYAKLIESSAHILDRFVSMRVGMTRTGFSKIKADFVEPVQPMRQKMIGNVLLYFYLISGALILRYPLPPQLPEVREARDRLVEAVRSLPVVQPRHVGTQQDPAYIYYYAYVMGMEQLVDELEKMGKCCIELFGVMALGGIDDAWRDRWGEND